ncbi:YdcF family protein [uncultured Treponema sp.]|uniref:YdcF family protein n=1 Tax=uncultured Treponema sp. TaxID=162155 RepID=UPI0025FF0843|nr:YdcF family protein [uncultured Treponema sp.]
MKSKIFYIIEYVLAEMFIAYSLVLHFMNPGTVLSELFAFCNVWLLIGAFLIFVGTYRKNHGMSLWYALKNWQKKTVVILLIAGIIISSINMYFICHPKVAQKTDADIVILLGGGIGRNGELPEVVKARAALTADYLKANPNAIAIATGGTLNNLPPEAPALKAFIVGLGISPERVLVEPNALDTIQNFQFSCKMLAEYKNCPQSQILESDILIVTSFFHLARAQRLADRMGFTHITGLGSKVPVLKVLDCYSREICAYIKLNLRILLTGKPQKILD